MTRPKIFLCHYSQWDMAQFKSRFLALLGSTDQARYDQFKHVDAGHQFLIGRTVLRQQLSQVLQQPAQSFVFSRNPFGRPQLSDAAINFNVSHTQGLVAITLAHELWLGIDVESTQRTGSTLAIADRFFHRLECNEIKAPADEWQQRENFFRFWTLKEAYVKALGNGLQRNLQSFYFSLAPDGGVTLTDEQAPTNNANTRLYNYRLANEYFCTWVAIGEPHTDQEPEIFLLDQTLQPTPITIEPQYRSVIL